MPASRKRSPARLWSGRRATDVDDDDAGITNADVVVANADSSSRRNGIGRPRTRRETTMRGAGEGGGGEAGDDDDDDDGGGGGDMFKYISPIRLAETEYYYLMFE